MQLSNVTFPKFQPALLKVKKATRQQLKLISKRSGRQVERGKIGPGVGDKGDLFFFGISVKFCSVLRISGKA